MAKPSLLLALWGALSLCLATPAYAGEERAPVRTALLIPAGALDDALKALAVQSHIQILYAPEFVAERRVIGLHARLEPSKALARLLRGSGLRAIAVNANTFLLQRIEPARGPVPGNARRTTPTEMASVRVTGSRIPRSDLDLVTPAPLTIITREDIEASGHQTLFELLRMQPGMQGHHPVDVASEGGQGDQQPFAAAATTSLNGLGPRATLFLIDGRRVANYGLISVDLGGLTDLDAIPLSIVERVEIMRGGASAIYGADAMAGVVNIILVKQRDAGEVVARYGLSEQGDAGERRVSFSQGMNTSGGSFFLGLDYLERDALIGHQRDWRTLDYRRRYDLGDWRIPLGYHDSDGNLVKPFCPTVARLGAGCDFDPVRWSTLQPRSERRSLYAHWQRSLRQDLQFNADVRVSNATQELQNPPFHALVAVPESHPDSIPDTGLAYAFFDIGPIRNHNRTRSLDVAVSLQGAVGSWDWNAGLSHDENKVRNRGNGLLRETVFTDAVYANQYRFGVWDNPPELLAAISPPVVAKGKATLDQLAAGLSGPWFKLPAGEARLAAGVEFNRDSLRHHPDPLMEGNDVALGPQKTPIAAHRYGSALYAELSLPLTRRLQADVAARLDHRQGYGSKTSPKLGLKWQALDSLTFRGTAATGYRAPSLFELRRPTVLDHYDVVQETPGLGPCRFALSGYCLVLRGAQENSQLEPETSRSHTLGLVWAPTPDLSLSIDQFRIERRNEILPGSAIDDPQSFPLSLQRDDDGLLIGINDYFANVGRSDVRGWEWEGRYRMDTERLGHWSFHAAGQYVAQLIRQAHLGAPTLDYAGFRSPDRRATTSVQWALAKWTSTLSLHYRGDVRVARPGDECPQYNVEAKKCRTPSSRTLDLNVAYLGFDDWQLALNVQNLRNQNPVNYDVRKGGYDIAYDDPRGRYYLLSATWRF